MKRLSLLLNDEVISDDDLTRIHDDAESGLALGVYTKVQLSVL